MNMIGIDEIDNKIIKLLDEKPLHPSEISRKLGILRTTIQYRLNRLHRAGLAKKTIKGRKSIWQPIYKNAHNKNHYRVYRGADIVRAYQQFLSLPRHTFILGVQGSEAARNEFNNLPPLFIKEAHKVFKRKGIIMKGISNEKCLGLFDELNKDMIKSHIGRTQGLKIFSDDKFLASGEIMSTEKLLLLSNPKSKFALVIKDEGITKIVNDTLKIIFGLLDDSKTFDLNRYLKTKYLND